MKRQKKHRRKRRLLLVEQSFHNRQANVATEGLMGKLNMDPSADLDSRPDKTMRKCMVTNALCPKSTMIRFVRDPEGFVVPDMAGKLPGRGCWVTASREALLIAYNKNVFTRGFADSSARSIATSSDAFVDGIIAQQNNRVMQALGLCRRAGDLITGFDKVLRALKEANQKDVLIIASDAGADGARKLSSMARQKHIDVVRVFDSQNLSAATGFDGIGYLFVSQFKNSKARGQPSKSLLSELRKYMSVSQLENEAGLNDVS